MLGTIKINVAYDNILVYAENGSPIIYQPNGTYIDMFNDNEPGLFNKNTVNDIEKKFSIKFPYKLIPTDTIELRNKLNIFFSYAFPFGFDYGVFNNGIITDFIQNNEKFIYPIVLPDNNIFDRNETIHLPDNLVNQIKLKNAKLVFCYLLEGHFGSTISHYFWLNKLSKKYGFNKEDVIFLTGNMITDEIHRYYCNDINSSIEDNFTVYPYMWFGNHLFFLNGGWKINTHVKLECYSNFLGALEENRTNKKEYHFISFNRLAKLHRACIFAELKTNPIFDNKYIVSFGNIHTLRQTIPMTFMDMIRLDIRDDYKYDKSKLIGFFNNHNADEHVTYDCSDFENNKAEVLNTSAHSKSFVNIVNESLINTNSVFFSEKIFKPITMAQPFILFGNPYSLKKLKEMGYKTFDKWWDESYDLETDLTRRLEKIIDIMIEIASWDIDKLYKITNEMEEILFHNFNILMSDADAIELYKKLHMGEIKKIKLL
jgi:hypothetical protein